MAALTVQRRRRPPRDAFAHEESPALRSWKAAFFNAAAGGAQRRLLPEVWEQKLSFPLTLTDASLSQGVILQSPADQQQPELECHHSRSPSKGKKDN